MAIACSNVANATKLCLIPSANNAILSVVASQFTIRGKMKKVKREKYKENGVLFEFYSCWWFVGYIVEASDCGWDFAGYSFADFYERFVF